MDYNLWHILPEEAQLIRYSFKALLAVPEWVWHRKSYEGAYIAEYTSPANVRVSLYIHKSREGFYTRIEAAGMSQHSQNAILGEAIASTVEGAEKLVTDPELLTRLLLGGTARCEQ